MTNIKEPIAQEVVYNALFSLAQAGCERALNINLTALVKSSPESFTPEAIVGLAMLGAETEEEVAFVRTALSALKDEE